MKPRRLVVFLPALFCVYVFYRHWSTLDETLIVLDQEDGRRVEEQETLPQNDNGVVPTVSRSSWKRYDKINLNLLKKKLLANKEVQPKVTLTSDNQPAPMQGFYSKVYDTDVFITKKPLLSNQRYANCNTTLVTSLMDIGRGQWRTYRRPYEMYQNFMRPLLQLDVCLYVFTDEVGAAFIRDQRKRYQSKTMIHVLSLPDLPYYAHYSTMKNIVDDEHARWNNEWEPVMRTHPESFSSEYLLLMNSKAYFVKVASDRNVFHSEHFFWLDAGYGHGRTKYPRTDRPWEPRRLTLDRNIKDRVTFMKLVNFDINGTRLKDLYRQDVALIVGSFFGGNKASVDNYFALYDNVFTDLLKKRYIDDDQTLTVLCYQSKPEMFNLVNGDWYDVFRLFS